MSKETENKRREAEIDVPMITQAMRDHARRSVEVRGAYAEDIAAQRRQQQSVAEQDKGMER
jgi:hypothetical protein